MVGSTRRSRGRFAGAAVLAAVLAIAPAAAARGDAAEHALERARALLQPPAAKAAASAAPAGRALSPTLARLAALEGRLHGADARAARAILARPDDGEDDRYGDGYTVAEPDESPDCTANFCVHWVDDSTDELDDVSDDNGSADDDDVPDFVEEVQSSAEESFATENGALGWREPKRDGTRGGGGAGLTDVYLIETNGAYFGYASPDEGQGPVSSKRSYLVLDNGFSEFVRPGLTALDAMRVTMAHEYSHVLQFTLDALQETWMLESTATWVENHVYPDIDDYLNYVPDFARSSLVPLTSNGLANNRVYGAAEWNHYLDGANGPDVIRDAWEDSDDIGAHLAVPAYDSALDGAGFPFTTVADEFAGFTGAAPEWRARGDIFPDAAELPDVTRIGALRAGRRPFKHRLDHLSYALLNVRAALAEDALELRARGPAGVRYSIDLVARTGSPTSGTISADPQLAPGGGRLSATLVRGTYDRVTAVVANVDARVNASRRYAADDSRFRLRLRRGDRPGS